MFEYKKTISGVFDLVFTFNLHSYFLLICSGLIFCDLPVSGQPVEKRIINQAFSILSYSNHVEISPKFSSQNEIQERNFIRPLKQSQFSIKSQVSYNFRKNWNGVAGVAYYLSSPGDAYSSSTLIVPEIRINQDLSYRQKFSAFSLRHRFRMEERFINKSINDSLIEGYKFKERLSYMLSFEYNLSKRNTFHELTFKASEGISIYTNNKFDQNRFYTGLNYQIEKNVYLELGYIKVFQQLSSGDRFYNRDMASLMVNHKINKRQANKKEL